MDITYLKYKSKIAEMNISDAQFVNVAQLYELNIDLSFGLLKSGRIILPSEKWMYCRQIYVVYTSFVRGQ